jgi:cytochrome c-type biogenesis protein CcmE
MNAAAGHAAPVSKGAAVKIVVSVLAVVGAIATLFYMSAVPGMEYYKYVDEVMAQKDQFRGKRLKVHGYVVEGSILRKTTDSLDYRFKLETRPPRTPAIIDVEYHGLVPDNFKHGAEVVAKGSLTADNRLIVVKEGIDAKCPSKYEAGAPKLNPGATNSAAPAPASPTTAQR